MLHVLWESSSYLANASRWAMHQHCAPSPHCRHSHSQWHGQWMWRHTQLYMAICRCMFRVIVHTQTVTVLLCRRASLSIHQMTLQSTVIRYLPVAPISPFRIQVWALVPSSNLYRLYRVDRKSTGGTITYTWTHTDQCNRTTTHEQRNWDNTSNSAIICESVSKRCYGQLQPGTQKCPPIW